LGVVWIFFMSQGFNFNIHICLQSIHEYCEILQTFDKCVHFFPGEIHLYLFIKLLLSQAPVAHACNPSYSEIRKMVVQSQLGLMVWETVSWKSPSQKRDGGVAWGVGPE
jgi:hypothetical protein